MKPRISLLLALIIAMSCLHGCNEPDRWHQSNPSHGEPGHQDQFKHGVVGADQSFGTGMGPYEYQKP
jgi:hypothetical protein